MTSCKFCVTFVRKCVCVCVCVCVGAGGVRWGRDKEEDRVEEGRGRSKEGGRPKETDKHKERKLVNLREDGEVK